MEQSGASGAQASTFLPLLPSDRSVAECWLVIGCRGVLCWLGKLVSRLGWLVGWGGWWVGVVG